jgi:hypothetical protein
MWIRRFLIAIVLLLGAHLVLAAPRTFPPNAQRGTISGGNYPQVLINGQTQLLAPGALIKDKQNLIIMPSTLGNQVLTVNYTFDNLGKINRAWILTDEELAQPSH